MNQQIKAEGKLTSSCRSHCVWTQDGDLGKIRWKVSAVAELLSLEVLNLQEGEYAVCLAKRNPFSDWFPMVIKRVRNGYVSPVLEQYVSDILGGFRIPDLTKAKEAQNDERRSD